MSRPRPSATSLVALALLGVVLGLVGSVVASGRITIGSVLVPWGVALMLVVLPVVVRGCIWQAGTRAAGMAIAGGWLLATAAVLTFAPGDDVLLPDLPRSWAYIVGGAVLMVVAIAWRLPEGLPELVAAEHVPVDGDVLPGLEVGASPDLPRADPSGDADGVR